MGELEKAWEDYLKENPLSDRRVEKWRRYCEIRDGREEGFYDDHTFEGFCTTSPWFL